MPKENARTIARKLGVSSELIEFLIRARDENSVGKIHVMSDMTRPAYNEMRKRIERREPEFDTVHYRINVALLGEGPRSFILNTVLHEGMYVWGVMVR